MTAMDLLEHLINHSGSLTATIFSIIIIYICAKVIGFELERRNIIKPLSQFPGAPVHWLLGSLATFPGPNGKGVEYWTEQTRKHPRGWKFFYGRYVPSLTLCHPDTIKVMLKTSEPKAGTVHKYGGYHLMNAWLGEGLLTSKNPLWFRDRRLLTPAFHFDILKPYMEVFNRTADRLLDQFEKAGDSGEPMEIIQYVSRATLDTILKCAFSYNKDVPMEGEGNPYIRSVYRAGTLLMERFYLPFLHKDWVYALTPSGREYNQAVACMNDLADSVVRERRNSLSENIQKSRYKDFLDILLLAKDEDGQGLTDSEIRFQVNTFMFEGHDTTASAISWVLFALAGHAEEQDRCRQEIHNILANEASGDITWDMMSNLPYLTQCIKEAMRLHSPVPYIRREATVACTIDGVTLSPGTTFDVGAWCIHHNPEVWGEDHMEFKPDRFLMENMNLRDSHAFLPFSAGPRNCIGQNFAMNEIKTYVARVINRYKLSIDESHPVEYLPEMVMRAKHGLKLFVEPINC